MNESPNTPVGLLRLGASTQVQVDVFSDGIIKAVQEGEISAIEVLVQLKAFEKAAGRILKEIQQNYVREADKYSEKSFSFHGNTIEKAEVGVKYDYKVCQDSEWEQWHSQETTAAAHRVEREKFLRSLPKEMVDPDTGAVIYPPKKTGTTSLKVTIR